MPHESEDDLTLEQSLQIANYGSFAAQAPGGLKKLDPHTNP